MQKIEAEIIKKAIVPKRIMNATKFSSYKSFSVYQKNGAKAMQQINNVYIFILNQIFYRLFKILSFKRIRNNRLLEILKDV